MKDHTDVLILAGLAVVFAVLLIFVKDDVLVTGQIAGLLPVIVGTIAGVARGSQNQATITPSPNQTSQPTVTLQSK